MVVFYIWIFTTVLILVNLIMNLTWLFHEESKSIYNMINTFNYAMQWVECIIFCSVFVVFLAAVFILSNVKKHIPKTDRKGCPIQRTFINTLMIALGFMIIFLTLLFYILYSQG